MALRVKKMFTLMCASLLLSLGLPAVAVHAAYPSLVIDGATADWSAITAAGTNGSGDVSNLKVSNDAGQLFMLIEGTGFAYSNTVHMYIFLDTDNNTATGLNATPWNTGGAANGSDYMIDNGKLYKFTGPNSSTWSWQDTGYTPATKRTGSVIELYVPLGFLGLAPGNTIRAGVQKTTFTLDGSGNIVSSAVSGAVPASGTNQASVALLNYASSFSPVWSGITAAAAGTGTVTSIKATSDGANLYLHADGSGFGSVSSAAFYINSDNEVATGYHATGWSSAGADHLIENGYLYTYNAAASNTSWSWSTPPITTTYVKTATTIDVTVPLHQLNLEPGATFRFGLILDNSSTNRAPGSSGSLPAVTLAQPYLPAIAATTVPWADIRDFLVQYTIEDQFDYTVFDDYEAVILDSGAAVTRGSVTQAKNNRPASYLIGYLSLGESVGILRDKAGNPLDIYFLNGSGNPVEDVNWPGSYYVDPRKPLWQDMVLNQYLPELYAKGFDGVFLDLVDIITIYDTVNSLDFTVAQQGMSDLIAALKAKYPGKVVIANGGASLLHGDAKDMRDSIDGFMIESLTSTWASPEIDPLTGGFKEWYHSYPTDTYDYEYGERLANHLNKIRFSYNSSGVVNRNVVGEPIKSADFFHVFSLDYVKDGSTPANITMMNDSAIRSWNEGFLPAVEAKELWVPPYNWLDTITTTYLTEPNFGNGLDVASMTASSTIDNFASGVGNWHTVRGGLITGSTDSATLSASSGAAKLDVVVRGTVATNGSTNDPISQKNAAGMVSKEWFTAKNLGTGTVTFDAKLSTALTSGKAFEIEMRDENGDYKTWRNPVTLTTSYQTITLNPATDAGYKAGTYGARDGFQADKVKSIEIRIVNTTNGSTDYTGSLYVDNLIHTP